MNDETGPKNRIRGIVARIVKLLSSRITTFVVGGLAGFGLLVGFGQNWPHGRSAETLYYRDFKPNEYLLVYMKFDDPNNKHSLIAKHAFFNIGEN